MEVASLVLGVAGLFSVCMDVLDRVSNYKEFSTQSRQTVVLFEANKVRLKEWAAYAGIENGVLKDSHHVRLDEPDILSAIKLVLEEISTLFDSIERSQSRLRIPQVVVSPAGSGGGASKNGSKPSIRGGISWSSRGKESFTSQVTIFGGFVDTLHDLLPKEKDGSDSLVKDFKALLIETRKNTLIQTQKRVDEWLDAPETEQQYETHLSACLDGTCNWITAELAYKTWESDYFPGETAKFLWICGPAGSGKSVLCAKIIQRFTEKSSHPLAYFFSTGHVQAGGHPDGAVRSWISQATRHDERNLELVQQAMDHAEAGRRASQAEVWKLFKAIASDTTPYTFVLDGLDEYEIHYDERAHLLRGLKEQAKGVKCRVLIVSLDEVDLNQELSPSPGNKEGTTMLECQISKSKTKSDIQLYSESVVNKKLGKKGASLRRELATQMAEKCGGMFLWIKMQQDQLRGGKNDKQLRNIVSTMPVGLHQIYERNWANIQRRPANERRRAMSILRWATFAYRPLKLSELVQALAICDGDDEEIEEQEEGNCENDLNDDEPPEFPVDELPEEIDEEYVNGEIKELCGSLIEVRIEVPDYMMRWNIDTPQGYGTIHLVHASVKEYLLLKFASSRNISSPSNPSPTASQAVQHSILAKTCLRYLTYPEVWDGGVLPTFDVDDGSFLNYAATSFDTHALAAGKNSQLARQISHFFHKSPNFIRWKHHVGGVGAGPLYHSCRLRLLDVARISLKEHGEDPDALAGRFGTALQVACFGGEMPIVELLVESGADVNLEGGEYGSAVNAAIAIGDNYIISYLINKGAKLDTKNKEGRTTIHHSAKNGNIKLLERLISNDADIAIADNEGVTPLHLAASSGNLGTVKFLLEKGADIEAVTSTGRTPLCYACQAGNTDMVKLLVREGADIHHAPSSGNTPVYEASCQGRTETLQYLINQGAVVTAESKALKDAASEGYTAIVKLLVKAGVSLEDGVGDEALYNASLSGRTWVIKFLLLEGVKAENVRDPAMNCTPLFWAVLGGHTNIVKLLLWKGASPNIHPSMTKDVANETMLVNAIRRGLSEISKALLRKGANVDPEHNFGISPLCEAIVRDQVEIVHMLRLRGADPTKRGNLRYTPLLQAAIRGNEIMFMHLVRGLAGTTNASVPKKYGTFLNAAAYGGSLSLVRELAKVCGPTQYKDSEGRNPAHFAARGGHADVLKFFLDDDGIDPQSLDIAGRGIVHHAACGGSVETLRVALEAQPPDVKFSENTWSPLHWACKRGSVEIVNLLLEYGVKESTVTTTDEPAAEWTPFRVAVYHQNKSLVRDWSETKYKLDDTIVLQGYHSISLAGCSWCLHELYGPRYYRTSRSGLVLCFMCKHTADTVYPDSKWKSEYCEELWTTDLNEGPKWEAPEIGGFY
ncbi:Ankyrin repeat domain-containing protein 52 [Trichophyton interdigitale]|uniref:Ankyrin repeat domain-containing protein 52 n=1 Tax=Trichophyton interdigitale TaxID=101480 RepID=A0A9P4YHV3_9EURO|nr:Ankyrin repeat domain-containing protein 52 [Trichophyton interdigitale]KAF3897398.1 Ankyrin repeat domain-containing protein 52 [Trichophyton interdigitale]KAG8208825.1 Ankyrin repeat domain-containing protein 52 [Trichophyton interdigitale]